jgi:hypothetical protein
MNYGTNRALYFCGAELVVDASEDYRATTSDGYGYGYDYGHGYGYQIKSL